MNHVAIVTKSSRLANLPFHAQCSCGTAGTFPEKDQAILYLQGHGQNVKALNVANTFELIDNSDKPEETAVLPKPHVAGVGSMPSSHAALGESVPAGLAAAHPGPPPAPPAPPSADEKKSESADESTVK